MKILTACVCSALALSAVTSAYSADANKTVANRDWSDTVAPADQDAYEAGVKAYNRCLRDNGVKYNEVAYAHETGDTYMYSYVIGPYTWADFDALRAQSKPCDAVWRAQANPHLKSETSAFMVDQTEMSHMPADWATQAPPALIDVVYFTLKQGHEASDAFTASAKKLAAAADKTKWPYYFRFLQVQGGGDGAPDYILVMPSKNWADYGSDANPSFWKMVESAYGKADADALRKSVNDSIEKTSDHIDSYDADLTYMAGK